MSGLTVGYLSIDELALEIKSISGTDEEKIQCPIIQNVLRDKHKLLVTLLISNAAAMESLPIFINKLVPEWAAIIISTTLVLFFGEVFPQAFCTGPDQLIIAAKVAPVTECLMWILYPLNEPLKIMLDKILGPHKKHRLMNTDLRTLIELHTHSALKNLELLHETKEEKSATKPNEEKTNSNSKMLEMKNIQGKNTEEIEYSQNEENYDSLNDHSYTGSKPLDMPQKKKLIQQSKSIEHMNSLGGYGTELITTNDFGLNAEQANLMVSAIEMKDKKAIEVMIPIKKIFMFSFDSPVNNVNLSVILEKGYSRIPVYAGNNTTDLIGLVRIKQLIGINLSDKKSMRQHNIQIKTPLVISPRMNLLELLREFKKGQSHMAFITEHVRVLHKKLNSTTTVGMRNQDKDLNNENCQVMGIVTLEDVIEKMINIDILDEDDYDNIHKDNNKSSTYMKSKWFNFSNF